jgi:hypothetical protein
VAQTTAALKTQQAQELLAAIQAIERIHRQEFVPASRPIAAEVAVTPITELRKAYERDTLEGVGRFARSARKAAKATALEHAEQYYDWLVTQAEENLALPQGVPLHHLNEAGVIRAALHPEGHLRAVHECHRAVEAQFGFPPPRGHYSGLLRRAGR